MLPVVLCLFSFDFALSQDALPSSQILQAHVVEAVVQLLAVGPGGRGRNLECSATGFLINDAGYLMTNAHVVEDARRCLKGSPGGKIVARLPASTSETAGAVACDLVGVDEVHDLAVLKTERPLRAHVAAEAPSVTLDAQPAAEGMPVLVSGHPAFAWQPVTARGRIVARGALRLSDESREPSEVLLLDIAPLPGTSGSPVFDEAGGVISVVVSKDPAHASHTAAIPIRYAIELLDRYEVKWRASPH